MNPDLFTFKAKDSRAIREPEPARLYRLTWCDDSDVHTSDRDFFSFEEAAVAAQELVDHNDEDDLQELEIVKVVGTVEIVTKRTAKVEKL